jgi:hypothetical protein
MVIVWYRFHPERGEDTALTCRVDGLVYPGGWNGGQRGTRTPDILLVRQAL